MIYAIFLAFPNPLNTKTPDARGEAASIVIKHCVKKNYCHEAIESEIFEIKAILTNTLFC